MQQRPWMSRIFAIKGCGRKNFPFGSQVGSARLTREQGQRLTEVADDRNKLDDYLRAMGSA